jgi:hypothetical protein
MQRWGLESLKMTRVAFLRTWDFTRVGPKDLRLDSGLGTKDSGLA